MCEIILYLCYKEEKNGILYSENGILYSGLLNSAGMQPNTAAIPHIGRKIERIRTIKGVKQKELADKIGMRQGTLSKIEQSETVDEIKLKQIADALEVSVDAIKNFNEEAVINNIQNNYDNAVVNSPQIAYQFNSVDKLTELFEENKKLYERLLESERKKNELLESLLKSK